MTDDRQTQFYRDPPVAVQILGTLAFGGFAIAATAMAFANFWPAGVALALVLAWRGGFVPQGRPQDAADTAIQAVCNLGQDASRRQTGNASFDAYRDEVLARLEDERQSFEGFLDRLRDARDKSEFDDFMDARAQKIGRFDASGVATA